MMKLKELFFPPRCPFCGRVSKREEPCQRCKASARELTGEVCRFCGVLPEDCFCRPLRPFAFDRNISAFYYSGGARTLVLRYKERSAPQLAPFMAKRMLRQIEGRLEGPFSAIVYVPNTARATLRRGYSPTRLLADELSLMLNVPVVEGLCRNHAPQQKYQKNSSARWKNAKENYLLHKGGSFTGNILLIDDITTTGASLDACAALLKKAGAERVYGVTFAASAKKKKGR